MTLLEQRAVQPFYLAMMGLNALHNSDALWDDMVAAGRSITPDETRRLLNVGAWRPVVMGAWFSTRFTAEDVGGELRRAMGASGGSLTAPPLAAACVAVAGTAGLEEMNAYVRRDPGCDGSAQIVGAGIEYLGASSAVPVSRGDDEAFRGLLAVANRLRQALG